MESERTGQAVLIAWLATAIKEADPAHVSGTASGVVSFINFTFSALWGLILARILFQFGADGLTLEAYQATFEPLLYGVGLAIVLTLLLEETGLGVRRLTPVPAEIRP